MRNNVQIFLPLILLFFGFLFFLYECFVAKFVFIVVYISLLLIFVSYLFSFRIFPDSVFSYQTCNFADKDSYFCIHLTLV